MLGDKSYAPGDVNWDYYGNKTEGWMAQDLVDLAEKAMFAAWKRHGNEISNCLPSSRSLIVSESLAVAPGTRQPETLLFSRTFNR